MSADDYNENELAAGRIKPAHVSELTARFQAANDLPPDGKLGPATRARIELLRGRVAGDHPELTPCTGRVAAPLTITGGALTVSPQGWLNGPGVVVMPIHRSRYYAHLSTASGRPAAIVAHYTATDHGSGAGMARRLTDKIDLDPNDGDGIDRQVSWHVSIEGDGAIIQMAPLLVGCWHAGGKTAKPIPGVGAANKTAIGIELVGHGVSFPEAQVNSAARVWRAIVGTYSIPRDLAMVTHESLDPTRKRDPGPVWMRDHAEDVLDHAYESV